MQVGKSLIVELLRLRRRGLHRVVRDTDAGPERHRTLRKGDEAGRRGSDQNTGHKQPGQARGPALPTPSVYRKQKGRRTRKPTALLLCALYAIRSRIARRV